MWPAALSAKLTLLLAFVSRGYGQRCQPTDGTNTCHSVQITKPKPSPDVTPDLALLRGLPMTNRARAWSRVRHMDENAALRRAVMGQNAMLVRETLAKGVYSNG